MAVKITADGHLQESLLLTKQLSKPKSSFSLLYTTHAYTHTHRVPVEWAKGMLLVSQGLYKMWGVSANSGHAFRAQTYTSLSCITWFNNPTTRRRMLAWSQPTQGLSVNRADRLISLLIRCPRSWASPWALWSCSLCLTQREAARITWKDTSHTPNRGSVTWRPSPRSKALHRHAPGFRLLTQILLFGFG